MRNLFIALSLGFIAAACSGQAPAVLGRPSAMPSKSAAAVVSPSPTPVRPASRATAHLSPTATAPLLTPGIYPITKSAMGLHIRSIVGDQLKFIPVIGAFSVAASPDGRSILIDQPHLALVDLASGLTNALEGFQPVLAPSWSPDGTKTVVVSTEDPYDFGSLFVLDLVAQTSTRVTYSRGFEEDPAWSPDGRWIAYASDEGKTMLGVTELYLLDTSCLNSTSCEGIDRRLEQLPEGRSAASPSWAPDSTTLVYVCSAEGDPAIHDLCTFDLPEGVTHPLLESPYREMAPAYSPDGLWIAYTRDTPGGSQIAMLLDTQTLQVHPISAPSGDEIFATWLIVH